MPPTTAPPTLLETARRLAGALAYWVEKLYQPDAFSVRTSAAGTDTPAVVHFITATGKVVAEDLVRLMMGPIDDTDAGQFFDATWAQARESAVGYATTVAGEHAHQLQLAVDAVANVAQFALFESSLPRLIRAYRVDGPVGRTTLGDLVQLGRSISQPIYWQTLTQALRDHQEAGIMP